MRNRNTYARKSNKRTALKSVVFSLLLLTAVTAAAVSFFHETPDFMGNKFAVLQTLSETITSNEACLPPAPVDENTMQANAEPSGQVNVQVAEKPAKPTLNTIEGVVQSGDTMTSILGRYFDAAQICELSNESQKIFSLSRIQVGKPYTISTLNGEFAKFEYDINADERFVMEGNYGEMDIRREAIQYDIRTVFLHSHIKDSLFGSIAEINESASLAFRIADIFAWDVDFLRDIRKGDQFSVLVDKRYREGEFAGYGKIHAAKFVNQDTPHYGFLFADAEDRESYYDETGRSLRKAFLKAPLRFSRISSGYNLRRLHPITHKVRAHPAIDYAAPTGTPVKAVGDGVATWVGRKGAAGKMIKLRHPNGYETYYLHLSRYAKGMKSGRKVTQGDTIGYVGSTGRSTGPHLDFRMKRNGSYLNPMRLKMPSAASVAKGRMPEFKKIVEQLTPQLETEAVASMGTSAASPAL